MKMEHPTTHDLLMTRSVLNPVAPIGVGTPEVESLLSYFCRLAMSHCISAPELGRSVARAMQWSLPERWRWRELNLSGMSDLTQDWSYALSKLTSVANLDSLTLLPWRDVIAESSRRTTSSGWCPQCFAEDRSRGATPYFRLSWDVGTVSACSKHKCGLLNVCPDCGRADVRHKCAYVVPGWCSSCDAFLGAAEIEPATPAEIWIASQVDAMLAVQGSIGSTATRETMLDGIRELVKRLDDGKSALFARRTGLSKTTVHYWLKNGGAPTLPHLLRIASKTGLALPDLLLGNLTSWSPMAAEVYELNELFPESTKRAPRQVRDWDKIRSALNAPSGSAVAVSVTEAARSLNINRRSLYGKANKEATNLAARRNQENQRRGEHNQKVARDFIEQAYAEIEASGKAVNLREIVARVPKDHINRCGDLLQLLRAIKEGRDSA